MKFEDLDQDARHIMYNLACSYGFGKYSTPDEIDYKFWEDAPLKEIIYELVDTISKLENKCQQN